MIVQMKSVWFINNGCDFMKFVERCFIPPGFHTEGGGRGGFIPLMILARGGYPPHQTAEQCFF